VEEKGDFVSTLIEELNHDDYGGGHGMFAEFNPYGLMFARGGFTYIYDPDPEVEYEYYVTRIDPSKMEWLSLRDCPDALLRLLELAGPPGERGYMREEDILAYLDEFGPLTTSFFRIGEEWDSEVWWNETDPRNSREYGPMFRFSDVAHRVRDAVTALRDGDLVSIFREVDTSPTPSLYRALLLYVLGLALSGEQAPRQCAGCGKWFFETENVSTAVHRTGWKRRDAKYHSVKCMKAAAERRRRARKREAASSSQKPSDTG
jgi:hypothetical protein